MVANTTYGKHFMTIVLYNRNDVLVKPISPAFINQAEPVLNRKNGLYMYLCVCVWHLLLLWRIPTGCRWTLCCFLPKEHPYGMNYLNEKAPFPTGNAPNLS